MCEYITRRKNHVLERAYSREKLKDRTVARIGEEKEAIYATQEEKNKEILDLRGKVEELQEIKRARQLDDEEKARAEEAKIQEKIDMDNAAKYIQNKWKWYQTFGKFLAKKRKKGKKGKKKKKK